MLNVRFYRTGRIHKYNNELYTDPINYYQKGQFVLKFNDISELVKFLINNFTSIRISPVSLEDDLSKEDFKILITKYKSLYDKVIVRRRR